MKSIYNITNDKLLAWFDERLPDETYQRMKRARFVWWPGRKCFAAKWSPQAEDLLLELGHTIEEDDTPDDLEARVERFTDRAEKAVEAAESSQNYLETRANTERRQKNAINAIQRETASAAHWNDRIAAAVRHASYRERPDVIGRRIQGLEADRRRHIASYTPNDKVNPIIDGGVPVKWYGSRGRGGYWASDEKVASYKAWADRWVAHIDMRLLYENACYEAAGGSPEALHPERKKAVQPKGVMACRADGKIPEFLGAAGFRAGYFQQGELKWRLITKVNRKTIEIISKEAYTDGSGAAKHRFYGRTVEIYCLDGVKSRKEVMAEMPHLHDEWEELQAMKARITERRQAAQVAPTEVKL